MTNIFKIVCLTGLLGVLSAFTAIEKHDFHTSLAEMRYNPSSKALEISIRVFTDDFLAAIEKANPDKKVIIESSESDVLVEKYFKKHFAFVKGEEVIFGNYIGKEVEPDASWIYIELKDASRLKGSKMLNTIFLELFDDQNNVVNIIYPEKKKSILFNIKEKLQAYPF